MEIEKLLFEKRRRLENLYKITAKDGSIIQFKPNIFQEELSQDNHNKIIVLKARQIGITTYLAIYFLDEVLFNNNYKHHIIAQDQPTAIKVFTNIIKFARDTLPKELKDLYEIRTDRANELSIKLKGTNDGRSTISVGTGARGTTLQSLHITEFGKVCNKYREKAREIVTGALNAIGPNQKVIIESTAEGNEGYFYNYCQEAQNNIHKGLSALDYSFHFYPRHDEPTYNLDDDKITITQDRDRYFDKLSIEYNIQLTLGQKRWYIKKYAENGDDMKREYPSTPKEAFDIAIEGAYYEKEIATIRNQNRLCLVPHDPILPVHTCWDLGGAGGGDDMVIRWFQVYGKEIRRINYWEGSGYGMEETIINEIQTKGYNYGYMIAPHDIKVKELSNAKSRLQSAQELGVNFVVCPSYPGAVSDGIQATKRILKLSYFDERCAKVGFERIAKYKRKYDTRLGIFRNEPEHDANSHASDAFRYGAVMIENLFFRKDDGDSQVIQPNYNLIGM